MESGESIENYPRRRPNARGATTPHRWILWMLLGVAVVIGVSGGLWWWRGRHAYARWRDHRLLEQCRLWVNEGKLADAAIGTRRLLDKDPYNLRAAVIQAEIAEQAGMRDAILWRSRVARIEPDKLEHLVAWAQTALRFGDLLSARAALDKFPSSAQSTIFHDEIAGMIELGLRNQARAEFYFARALEKAPADESKKLNLARVQIRLDNSQARQKARAILEGIQPASTNYSVALSLLTSDALNEDQLDRAAAFSAALAQRTNAAFADRLIRLSVLLRKDRNAFTNELETFKFAARHPDELTLLLSWLMTHGYGSSALAWVRSRPPDEFKAPAVGMAVAELYVSVGDWLGLRNWARSADWVPWNAFRYAYQARAAQHLGREEQATASVDGLWQKAIDAAGHPIQLELLATTAQQWQMKAQAERTWWALANSSANRESALMTLYGDYLRSDNTLGQYKVARKLLEINRANQVARNNAVYLGLLLRLNENECFRMAEDLRAHDSKEGEIVATYAFALFRQNRIRDGLEKLAALPPSELNKPAVALTYGYLLAQAGELDKAKPLLMRAQQGKLLPEELVLLQEAKGLARLP